MPTMIPALCLNVRLGYFASPLAVVWAAVASLSINCGWRVVVALMARSGWRVVVVVNGAAPQLSPE